MNILFLSLLSFESLQDRNIYTDLLREFVTNNHNVYAISPAEKRQNIKTHLIENDSYKILRLQIGNTQKTNVIEKGISTILIEPTFKKAIKKYFSDIKFDLILYTTPPITLVSAIKYVKIRDNAKTYLLLKDIFPQNAVDLGMINKNGIKGFIYKHFRKQEKELYKISDIVGCMSQANVDYLIKNNPEIKPNKVEICPNCIEVIDKSVDDNKKKIIREKYSIPLDKKILIYGGNLGKPQGIPFIIQCLKSCKNEKNVFFLIVGDGTEYNKLSEFINKEKPNNIKLMRRLPKEDYDTMVGACDIGMIFLDYRFSIPNFPSRILSYMQAKLPILAVTDCNTDIGEIITKGEMGWWCESNDSNAFHLLVKNIISSEYKTLGENAYEYCKKNYNSNLCYEIIKKSVDKILY